MWSGTVSARFTSTPMTSVPDPQGIDRPESACQSGIYKIRAGPFTVGLRAVPGANLRPESALAIPTNFFATRLSE